MATDFTLSTTAFIPGDAIPEAYTCDGENTSPEITWGAAPEGTESFALVLDDPDAAEKAFAHWLVFNLPPDLTSLPVDVDLDAQFGDADPAPIEGVNDFGDQGYGGPCPPAGEEHQYVLRLLAVDTVLDLSTGVTREQLFEALDGHVLDEANYYGTYRRTG